MFANVAAPKTLVEKVRNLRPVICEAPTHDHTCRQNIPTLHDKRTPATKQYTHTVVQ